MQGLKAEFHWRQRAGKVLQRRADTGKSVSNAGEVDGGGIWTQVEFSHWGKFKIFQLCVFEDPHDR